MTSEFEKMRKRILEQMDLDREISDGELYALIDREIAVYGKMVLLSLKEREEAQRWIFNSLRKLDVLQELLEQEGITEIMVNGPERIFYEKEGRIFPWDKSFSTKEKLENVVQQIAALSNKSVNEAEPITDTRLSDGSRVNIILKPAALDGPYITIRRFSRRLMSLQQLCGIGTLSGDMREFLVLAVRAGYNIFVSGGTGSGKTTLLNALSEEIPKEERVVTIEDSAELQMDGVENLVRLETRSANVNGAGEISIRDLIKTALRLRPDRIVVGEVRGAEALDLLQALNTGHDGGLSTGHGNSCPDMLSRLETMVLMGMDLPLRAVRGQIASGIDLLIHMGRMPDKSRKILDIMEVEGMKAGEIVLPLYQFQKGEEGEGWFRRGKLKKREKMDLCGYGEKLEQIYGKNPGPAGKM